MVAMATNSKSRACERCGFLVEPGQGKLVEQPPIHIEAGEDSEDIPRRPLAFHSDPTVCTKLQSIAAEKLNVAVKKRIVREGLVARIMGAQ